MSATTDPLGTTIDRGALRIERIETIALRAPLARRFVGSAYSMTHRSTIITRLYTSDGVVGEVYNGDTDAEQALILDIIHQELAPRVIGRSASDPEGAWAAMEPSTNDILRDRLGWWWVRDLLRLHRGGEQPVRPRAVRQDDAGRPAQRQHVSRGRGSGRR